jgi:hypothetical protein
MPNEAIRQAWNDADELPIADTRYKTLLAQHSQGIVSPRGPAGDDAGERKTPDVLVMRLGGSTQRSQSESQEQLEWKNSFQDRSSCAEAEVERVSDKKCKTSFRYILKISLTLRCKILSVI